MVVAVAFAELEALVTKGETAHMGIKMAGSGMLGSVILNKKRGTEKGNSAWSINIKAHLHFTVQYKSKSLLC